MAARIVVLPSPICLYDDPVQVKVEGLSALQAVTLRASLEDETGELFQSFAYYGADSSGELDLTSAASLGGSYSGVEPMGLLWSLAAKSPFKRLAKRNVLSPFYVAYEVYEGHGVGGQLLGRCVSERRFLAEGVKRTPVREGRLKATLFLPPGEFGAGKGSTLLHSARVSHSGLPVTILLLTSVVKHLLVPLCVPREENKARHFWTPILGVPSWKGPNLYRLKLNL